MPPAHRYCRVKGLEKAMKESTMDRALRNVVTVSQKKPLHLFLLRHRNNFITIFTTQFKPNFATINF